MGQIDSFKNKIGKGFDYINSLALWGGKGDFNLEVISKIVKDLDNPQDKPKSIHIAGTNGKGSVLVSIASILSEISKNIGFNVSPNLQEVNERFVINGKSISDTELDKLALVVKKHVELANVKLSYWETMAVIAFLAFKDLDWGVFEVGLGGRLDATNVLTKPEASIITSISYDHTHILGNTLEKIAFEKAGIIKEGVPVFVGEVSNEALKVILDVAKAKNSSAFVLNRDFKIQMISDKGKALFSWEGKDLLEFTPPLKGIHQVKNIALSIAVACYLGISKEKINTGLNKFFWPGRIEEFNYKGRRVILDCAHNIGGIKALSNYVNNKYDSKIEVAFGALETKNWKEMITTLIPKARAWHILSPDSHRKLKIKDYEDYISSFDIRSFVWDKDYSGFIRSLEDNKDIPILICGSMYLIGALRRMIKPEKIIFW